MNWKEKLTQELNDLEAKRDELRVQLHLGKAELKTQWEKAEDVWVEVRRKVDTLEATSEDAAKDVVRATRDLLHEIRTGYERMK